MANRKVVLRLVGVLRIASQLRQSCPRSRDVHTLILCVSDFCWRMSHCSLWSCPAVWRGTPDWPITERDADRWRVWDSVLCANHRTSAHVNRVVRLKRTTGVEGFPGWGEARCQRWGSITRLPKLPRKPRWKVRVQSGCFRELLGEVVCLHWWVLSLGGGSRWCIKKYELVWVWLHCV